MAQRRLIKFYLGALILLSSAFAAESDFVTLKDETYFISKNCQDLSCHFMKELKGLQLSHSPDVRPGIEICKNLKGIVEEVTLKKVSYPVQRCVFTKEKTFISLNLLESWDGKSFKGPSTPIGL